MGRSLRMSTPSTRIISPARGSGASARLTSTSPSITALTAPYARSHPSPATRVSSMPRPAPITSSDARPDIVSRAVSKPRSEAPLARRMATITATPRAMPPSVTPHRSGSRRRNRTMNVLNNHTCRSARRRAVLDAHRDTVAHVDGAVGHRRHVGRMRREQDGDAVSRFSDCSNSSTLAPLAESRLPVGSSATSRRGWCTIARAMAVRCISPPDTCCGK
jgi:hypothetical protein